MRLFFRIAFLAIVIIFGSHGTDGAKVAAQTIDSNTDEVLKKANLKILHIGNSFTFDAVSYLPLIVGSTGADVSDLCIYRTMRSGGSFKSWYDCYYDNDHELGYTIEKVIGGIDANINTGSGMAGDGSLFRQALNDEQWDIVVIQPASAYSPYYEQWTGTGSGGYLNELLQLIKERQPQALVGMMLVHSYASNYAGNTEKSSYDRWKLIAESVESCCKDYNISFVIPYGTAVQNLRATSLNNDMDLTADGVHCEYVLTRYTASCCYYQSVLAPRTGISVTNDKTRINKDLITSASPMISIDDDTAPIAQDAAVKAVENWYSADTSHDDTVPGDVNEDGVVDVADIASVISVMSGELSVSKAKADVNGDGTVDVADIATVIFFMSGGSIVIN